MLEFKDRPKKMLQSEPRVPTEMVDGYFIKQQYRTYEQTLAENAARKEELEFWIDHCKKRRFLQSLTDMRVARSSDSQELLYYCPRRGPICMVLDFRGHQRLLEMSRDSPYACDVCCRCGTLVERFQKFLPREKFMQDYGEARVKAYKIDRKDK